MVDVGGDDGPAPGDLRADEFRLEALPHRHEFHLGGDLAAAGVVQLRHPAAGPGPQRRAWLDGHDRGRLHPADGRPTVISPRRLACRGVDVDVTAGGEPALPEGREAALRVAPRPAVVVAPD